MTETEIESIARRYAKYCGLQIIKFDSTFKLLIGDFMFTSYSTFLSGEPNTELSYNDIVKLYSDSKSNILEYSTAEELDFKLSAMGF